MPARNVYGKRPAAKQALAERIFAASSSPVKPSPPRILRETPERRRRCQGEEGELVEGTVGEMQSLRLGVRDESADVELGEEHAEEAGERREDRGALRSRDANTAARGYPRRRGEKAIASMRASAPASSEPPSNPPQPVVPSEAVDQQAMSRADITVSQTDGAVSISAGPKSRRRRDPRTKGDQTTPSPQASDHLIQYAFPLLSLSSDASASITPFSIWSQSLAAYFEITKIAEASFGEVYRLSLLAPSVTLGKSDESVLKIIALKPPVSDKLTPAEQRRIGAMSDVQDVANEIRLLRHLSPVPGFTNFRDIKMVKGRLPREFVAAWKTFNKEVKKSEFPDPSRKGTHGEDQLWAVVEMQDAGVDVESCIEKGAEVSVCGVWEVFWSVAGAVAKAEEYCGFEHRDLHLGNICIRPRPMCPTNGSSEVPQDQANSMLNPRPSQAPPTLETTIIDYTLSRALIPPNSTSTSTSDKEEDEAIAFFDLSRDPAVFEGDASQEYQYAIYRYMRAAVLTGDPAASPPHTTTTRKGKSATTKGRAPRPPPAECQRAKWKQHHPLTNLVWLHFVLSKLLAAMDATLARRGRGLTGWEEKVLRRLRKLGEVLDIGALGAGEVRSAVGLLGWAFGRGWLGVGEILGVEGGEFEEGVGGEGGREGFDDLVGGLEKMEIGEGKGARRARGGDGGIRRLDDV